MKILDRYIIQEFSKLFAMITITFILLYLIIDFFNRARMFLSNNATIEQMILYSFFSIPISISFTLPSAVLLTTLMIYGSFSKSNEITAMKSNGISLYRISLPALVFSVFIAVILFFFSELIIPASIQKTEYIKKIEIQKRQSLGSFKQNELWYRSDNAIYNFKLFDVNNNTLHGIIINYINLDDFKLKMRIDAKKAEWKDGHWVFYNTLTTAFDENDSPIMKREERTIISLPENPDDFKIIQKDAEQMGYFELRKYTNKIQNEGYDVTRYKTDLHGKIAFPFVTIILVFIGVFFSLRSERSGGMMQSIGIGIFIGFSYFFIHAYGISLGRSGMIPPILGGWSANIIFIIASVYLFHKART